MEARGAQAHFSLCSVSMLGWPSLFLGVFQGSLRHRIMTPFLDENFCAPTALNWVLLPQKHCKHVPPPTPSGRARRHSP